MWSAGPARRRPPGGRPALLRPGFLLMRGQVVGLFGGSFNPAHDGHAHVAETALKRLALDKVIWLVSPQNPLKSSAETAGLKQRMASAARFARGPSMIVSDVETAIGSQYTIDTLRALKARFPGVHFVWIMGADNLAEPAPLARLAGDPARGPGGGDRPARVGHQEPAGARRRPLRPSPPALARSAAAGPPRPAGLALHARAAELQLLDQRRETTGRIGPVK